MTVALPVVTLGGVVLAGQAAYDWPLTTGVLPHEARFEVTLATWAELEPFAGISTESPGMTYLVTVGGKEVQRVERLFIVDAYPGATKFTKRIRVVDRRWLWSLSHVATSYNVRRATGESITISDGQNPEIPQILPRVAYVKPTLQDETAAWTALEVLKDVFRKVDGREPTLPAKGLFEGVPVDDLVIDDPGHYAIERVLAYFPGAAVYLDRSGWPVIKDTTSGDELGVFEDLKEAQQVNRGADLTTRKWARPSHIDVLFTPELDVRFNYEEAPTGTTTNSEDTNRLYNVGQVSEATGLELTDGTKVGPGSWVKLTDLFDAWGTGPGLRAGGGTARKLSFDILRRQRASDYRWINPEFLYIGAGPSVDGQWAGRLQAATNAYRRTFMIARDFMARLESVRPVRVSVVNTALGTRAASPIYSDYTMRPSYKGNSLTVPFAPQGVAQRGYADLITSSTLQPAPARVVPLDPAAGIFAFLPKPTDTKGYYSDLILGYPDSSSVSADSGGNIALGLPVQALGLVGAAALPIRNQFRLMWDQVDLEADWKAATIMSCVPNSPNDASRLYKVKINANQVGETEALGPPMTVRIYPGVVTARFAWLDGDSDTIVGRIRGDTTAWPSQLVNRKHVEDVARAAALRVYEQYKDRPFGSMQIDSELAGDVEPVGAIQSVAMQMQGGATTTRITFGTVASPLDIWRYLPGSTRRALLRSQLSVTDPLASAMGVF